MNLSDVLRTENIDLSGKKFRNKEEAFLYMAEMLKANGFVSDTDTFIDALYQREEMGSTYMGNGLAVPHGRSSAVEKNTAAFCRCQPFTYCSNDEEGEVRMIMMLAVSDSEGEAEYLRMLANLSRLILNEEFYEMLQTSEDSREIVEFGEKTIENMKCL